MRLAIAILASAAAATAAASSVELSSFSLAAEADLPAAQRSGAALTAPGFSPSGAAWTAATVPCTVVACLMQAGRIAADIFVGDNIRAVNASRFDGAWWYFAEFALPSATPSDAFTSLALHGIGYRGHVFLNGALIADNSTVVGAFSYFELDLTAAAARGAGAVNRMAIRVTRQYDESLGSGADATIDLGITFVDWSYAEPPDSNLGLWRKVLVSTHGPVTLRSPAVLTALPAALPVAQPAALPVALPAALPTTSAAAAAAPPAAFAYADLTVVVEARNFDTANELKGELSGSVLAPTGPAGAPAAPLCSFSVNVLVPAGAEATLTVTRADAPCLRIATPQLWWPWQMGAPTLHALNLSLASAAGLGSDALATPFGIRLASSNLTADGLRSFSFNSVPVLVRAGGWSPDLFQRVDAPRLDRQLALTRDLGLNAIRFEGKLEPDELFSSLDELGIMSLPGWCCCDAWQHWPKWAGEQFAVAALSMRSQARRLRRFAGILAYLISSDELPPRNVEQLYIDELANASWPLFAAQVSAASAATSPISGPTGVKMSGPYSWVPPTYWLEDTGDKGLGGAWGMLTEGGPGETPMTLESIVATLPANASVWPPAPDSAWGKAGDGKGNFNELTRFNTPLAARFGAYSSAADYLAKSAAASIEGHKAFAEAYSLRKHASSKPAAGFVQWMLNNDAPSNIWHVFHHDLTVGSAGVGFKQALAAPLHLAFVYSDRSVALVNSLYAAAPDADLVATIETFSLADETIFSASAPVPAGSVGADAVVPLPALQAPPPIVGGGAFFLRLTLRKSGGTDAVDTNTYWLPEKADVIDWGHSTWYNSPCSSYANLTGLFSAALGPPSAVTVSATYAPVADPAAGLESAGARWLATRAGGAGPWTRATITVANGAAGNIAFLVRLRIVPANGSAPGASDPAPIFFGDNYLVLRRGETRTVVAEFADAVLGGASPAVRYDFGGGGAE